MTRSEIETLVERGKAGWRNRDVDELLAGRAPDCIVESPFHGIVKGRDAIAAVYRSWLTAFPDATFQPTDLVVDGDRVVMFWTFSGTHSAEFAGFAPTGRHFSIVGISLFTIRDDYVVHERRYYDVTALLVQVGVLKARPA
jgi:steroid delta-isomerase-like uncharacterized protein